MSDIITVAEAADIMNLSLRRVRELCQRKELPAIRLGRDWAIRRRDAERFVPKPRGNPGKSRRKAKPG